jgi:hypothetical protein
MRRKINSNGSVNGAEDASVEESKNVAIFVMDSGSFIIGELVVEKEGGGTIDDLDEEEFDELLEEGVLFHLERPMMTRYIGTIVGVQSQVAGGPPNLEGVVKPTAQEIPVKRLTLINFSGASLAAKDSAVYAAYNAFWEQKAMHEAEAEEKSRLVH